MTLPILSSIGVLTGLLTVGLVFFVRAAGKDRTQEHTLPCDPNQDVVPALDHHLKGQGYTLVAQDTVARRLVWEGRGRPSGFLTFFLGGMVGVNAVCLGLVLESVTVLPPAVVPALALLGPLAAGLYWRQAGRPQRVQVQLDPGPPPQFVLRAQRHELPALSQVLQGRPAA